MEFSNTDRLNAVLDIRQSILEASGRRRVDDRTGHSFDQLLGDDRYQIEDDRRLLSSRDLTNWAKNKEVLFSTLI